MLGLELEQPTYQTDTLPTRRPDMVASCTISWRAAQNAYLALPQLDWIALHQTAYSLGASLTFRGLHPDPHAEQAHGEELALVRHHRGQGLRMLRDVRLEASEEVRVRQARPRHQVVQAVRGAVRAEPLELPEPGDEVGVGLRAGAVRHLREGVVGGSRSLKLHLARFGTSFNGAQQGNPTLCTYNNCS